MLKYLYEGTFEKYTLFIDYHCIRIRVGVIWIIFAKDIGLSKEYTTYSSRDAN